MKYTRFWDKYSISKPIAGEKPIMNDIISSIGINELPTGVYLNGIYTIVTRKESTILTKMVEAVFPMAGGKIAVYAVDWMGRLFSTDTGILDSKGAATITCFDLAEPSSFTTDKNFEDFHNITAIDMMAELFNLEQYSQWIAKNDPPDDGTSCIGYMIPLFIGGQDSQDNMEKMDRSVYLHTLCELWHSANKLPQGTIVQRVDFE